MTHPAMTPLLGPEFDPFLFASIGEGDGPQLSVVSALARLDLDAWREAECLARMGRNEAKQRLASHIRSLPAGAVTGLSPENAAARLIALLPEAGMVNTVAAATLRPVLPIVRSRLFVGVGILALALVGYYVFAAGAPDARGGGPEPPRATSQPAARR